MAANPEPEDRDIVTEPQPGGACCPGAQTPYPVTAEPAAVEQLKRNRRAFWSLIIFCVLFGLSLLAEFIANDKPILVQYRGEFYTPIFNFYAETDFGGDFRTEAAYRDPEVQCLIRTGGLEECFDDPEGLIQQVDDGMVLDGDFQKGWSIWPPIPMISRPPWTVRVPPPAPERAKLAGNRRYQARCDGASDLWLPVVDPVHSDRHRACQRGRDRRGRVAGLFRRLA